MTRFYVYRSHMSFRPCDFPFESLSRGEVVTEENNTIDMEDIVEEVSFEREEDAIRFINTEYRTTVRMVGDMLHVDEFLLNYADQMDLFFKQLDDIDYDGELEEIETLDTSKADFSKHYVYHINYREEFYRMMRDILCGIECRVKNGLFGTEYNQDEAKRLSFSDGMRGDWIVSYRGI